jgi:hypothetical protein
MKPWEIIADNLSKARLKLGVVSQPWIRGGEQSGLQTRITATINPS